MAPLGSCTKAYWAQWSSLQLVDGVLYRLWETPEGDNVVKQLIVPKAIQETILRELHSIITAGHFGVTKTFGRVRERFYWVNCRQPSKIGATGVTYVQRGKAPRGSRGHQ